MATMPRSWCTSCFYTRRHLQLQKTYMQGKFMCSIRFLRCYRKRKRFKEEAVVHHQVSRWLLQWAPPPCHHTLVVEEPALEDFFKTTQKDNVEGAGAVAVEKRAHKALEIPTILRYGDASKFWALGFRFWKEWRHSLCECCISDEQTSRWTHLPVVEFSFVSWSSTLWCLWCQTNSDQSWQRLTHHPNQIKTISRNEACKHFIRGTREKKEAWRLLVSIAMWWGNGTKVCGILELCSVDKIEHIVPTTCLQEIELSQTHQKALQLQERVLDMPHLFWKSQYNKRYWQWNGGLNSVK